MSSRRFAAYFFAVAAGSTFAFASTLRGQPEASGGVPEAATQQAATQQAVTQRDAVQQAAMRESLMRAGMTPTATDLGLDALPPETARLFRQGWDRRRRPAARTPKPD